MVLHPGSYRDYTLPEGIAAVALGLEAAAKGLGPLRIMVLLENTVGCGSPDRLAASKNCVPSAIWPAQLTDLRIGYCLDTCHLLAAGFDIATRRRPGGNRRAEADGSWACATCSVIHANDSKTPLGSHVDRHENIGEGYIGADGVPPHPGASETAVEAFHPRDAGGRGRRRPRAISRNVEEVYARKAVRP